MATQTGAGGGGMEIRINPDRVRSAGQEFGKVAEQTEQQMKALDSLMNGMHDEWKGLASQQFYQEFSQWQTTVKNYVLALRDISKDLTDTAQSFVNLENELKARIGKNG